MTVQSVGFSHIDLHHSAFVSGLHTNHQGYFTIVTYLTPGDDHLSMQRAGHKVS